MHVSFVFASVSRKAGGLFGVGHRLAQELSKLEEIGASVLGLVDEFTDQDRALWAPKDRRAWVGLRGIREN
jgi:hypothetical protein